MPSDISAGKPTLVAIYARVSSERQAAEDRVSIEVQLSESAAYCEKQGYKIVARYVDKEKYRVKGKLVQPSAQRKDRPAYQEMLAAARSGEFNIIVAWKEDRLYRGMYAAMPLAELLDEKGNKLNIELIRETFDRKMLGIKAALGKIEVDNIRERTIMGRRARLAQGEVPGGDQVKYGYRKNGKELEIEEQEAEIVCKIFAWYIVGETNMEIRRRLNASGIRPRRAKFWSKATLEKILTGEFYATGKNPTLLEGETFYIAHPPILSLETWQKAVEVRHKNKSKARNLKTDYLCVGLTYCVCGWKCQARTVRVNVHKGYHSFGGAYACQRSNTSPETRPPGCVYNTGTRKVDDYVWHYVKQICANPALVKAAVQAKLEQIQTEHDHLEQEFLKLKFQLDNIAEERQWVITQARKGRITEEDMELQLGQLQLQEWNFRQQLDEYKALLAMKKQAEALTEWAEQYLGDIRAGLAALDVDAYSLSEGEFEDMFTQFQAWRFCDKFPNDRQEQLKWAILEEKRRVVRTLIDRVILSSGENGQGRKITPILALDIGSSSDESLASGHQSLEYINAWNKKQALAPVECAALT